MLFQPSNIYPSTFSGIGAGTVDVTQGINVSWQVNGDTPMTAYQIKIYQNDSGSTLMYDSGSVTVSPAFEPHDKYGNATYFTAIISAAALSTAGVVNGYQYGYKMLITQWWGVSDYVEQTSASVFITRSTPNISIDAIPNPVAASDITITATYSQAQGDPISTVEWVFALAGSESNPIRKTGAISTQVLSFDADGLITGNTYSIMCNVVTSTGMEASTGYVQFPVLYSSSSLGINYQLAQLKNSSAVYLSWDDLGSNILAYPYTDTTKTTNGITFTVNGEGDVVATGTATADAYFTIAEGTSSQLGMTAGKKFVITSGYNGSKIVITETNGSNVVVSTIEGSDPLQYIATSTTNTLKISIVIPSGFVLSSGQQLKPMIALENKIVAYNAVSANIEPIQDLHGYASPWIGTDYDQQPYNFRAVSSSSVSPLGNSEMGNIVGGTVAWNQLQRNTKSTSSNGTTYTYSNGKLTIETASGGATDSSWWLSGNDSKWQWINNHVYFIDVGNSNYTATPGAFPHWYIPTNPPLNLYKDKNIIKYTNNTQEMYFQFAVYSGNEINMTFTPQIFDLTQMFGSTIADYIYSLEQANAGAGVAWFRKLFPKPYYAYDAGSLQSVNTSAHNMVGFNALNINRTAGTLTSGSGNTSVRNDLDFSKYYLGLSANNYYDPNYVTASISNGVVTVSNDHSTYGVAFPIKAVPNTKYCFHCETVSGEPNSRVGFYDADGNLITYVNVTVNSTFTTPDNCATMTLTVYPKTKNTSVTIKDICINLSWDGEKDGTYEPYELHSYALDSSLTLRGIPKLDSDNKLYYDGDTYESDGTVTRKYGERAYTSGDESLADAITDGTNTVYKLTTPTTETATAYTATQSIDPDGTEEYVDYAESQGTRDVAIPVGHYTNCANICPISGRTGLSVYRTGANLFPPNPTCVYGKVRDDNGDEVVSSTSFYTTTSIPVKASTKYTLKLVRQKAINSARIYYLASDGSWISQTSTIYSTPTTFTTPSGCGRLEFQFSITGEQNLDNFDLYLNEGGTATTEPFGTTYSVDWSTQAGTVYGGTVDVVTGVLTVNKVCVNLGDYDWTYDSTYTRFQHTFSNIKNLSARTLPMQCSALEPIYDGRAIGSVPDNAVYSGNTVVNIKYSAAGGNTTAFKTAMNGVQLVYELATPITYQLTPMQVAALVTNNVWTNAGDVTVSYTTDTGAQATLTGPIVSFSNTNAQSIPTPQFIPGITGLSIYRYLQGELALQHVYDLATGATSILDYFAPSQTKVSYLLVAHSNAGDLFLQTTEFTPTFWFYSILLCDTDSNGNYHVSREYIFKYGVETGAVSNNNDPTIQKNFTPYPNRQPISALYKTGKLSGYIGKTNNLNQYSDSISLQNAIYDISVSTLDKFLKSRKGDVIKVDTASSIQMKTEDNTTQQALKATIDWVEVGDSSDVSIVSVPQDSFWPLA